MGRSNVILVGSVVLAPLILATEGYALYRSHHRPRASPSLAAASLAEAPPQGLPPPPPDREAIIPLPVQPPAARAELTDDQAAAAPPAAAAPSQSSSSIERRRRLTRAADELAFDGLNFPEAQRAAIRAINNAYVDASGRSAQASDGVAPEAADQARRQAIIDLLGPDGAHAFSFTEHKAERRVRSQYRSESASHP
jgi:hypothetical protein